MRLPLRNVPPRVRHAWTSTSRPATESMHCVISIMPGDGARPRLATGEDDAMNPVRRYCWKSLPRYHARGPGSRVCSVTPGGTRKDTAADSSTTGQSCDFARGAGQAARDGEIRAGCTQAAEPHRTTTTPRPALQRTVTDLGSRRPSGGRPDDASSQRMPMVSGNMLLEPVIGVRV